ncbi:hypothetical protein QTP88_019283 [Uroleucon formosanum]
MRKKSAIAVATGHTAPAGVVVIVQPKQEADAETSTEEDVAAAEETVAAAIADEPSLSPVPETVPISSRLFTPSPPPSQQIPGPQPGITISTVDLKLITICTHNVFLRVDDATSLIPYTRQTANRMSAHARARVCVYVGGYSSDPCTRCAVRGSGIVDRGMRTGIVNTALPRALARPRIDRWCAGRKGVRRSA